MKNLKKYGKGILFIIIAISFFAFSHHVEAEEPDMEITIYGIGSREAGKISIPDSLPQSFQLNYGNSQDVKYHIFDGDSANISQDGLITPRYFYWKGNSGSPQQTNDYDYYTLYGGTTKIEAETAGKTYYITVHVIDYSIVYCDEIMDTYLQENITDAMTDIEKMEALARFPAQYDYSTRYSNVYSMILYGGGDCAASTNAIITLCSKLGIESWGIDGSYAGYDNHVQPIVELNGVYYVIEASYTSKKGEDGYRNYNVWKRTSLFQYYENNNYDGVIVTQYDGHNTGGILEVPEMIDGLKVKGLDKGIFQGRNFSEIMLPDTLTSIGDEAFRDCFELESIHIPASVTYIGEFAFENCWKLKNLSVAVDNPNYKSENQVIYSKDSSVLVACPVAKEIEIPSTVTKIGDSAFSGNVNIEHVVIPESVSELGKGAFNGTFRLKSITIEGDNLAVIGPGCFADSGIAVIRLPASVKSLGVNAFMGCYELKHIYFSGNAPEFGGIIHGEFYDEVFLKCTANAYYIADDPTWTQDVLTGHSGTISWIPYTKGTCQSIENAVLALGEDIEVNQPSVTVTLNGTVLEQNKDYIVCYIFNLPDAEYYVAKALVLGIGSYEGEVSVIYITNKQPRNITANAESSTIETNTITRIVVADSVNENCTYTYSSNDTSVAVVDSEGVVTGIAPGKAVITVTVPETEIYKKASTTVKITVTSNQKNNNEPTAAPSVSPSPTVKPTATPGALPSPTAKPTATPDVLPSPTVKPTATLGVLPSPTVKPTATPDALPSPTIKPTMSPSASPSEDAGFETGIDKKVVINGINYKVTSVKDGSRTVECTGTGKNNKDIVIPPSIEIFNSTYKVTAIAKNSFMGNKKISKITIGKNIEKIGKNAFNGCKNLKYIVIKTNKLTNKMVGKNAFKGIDSKVTIKVPGNKVKAYKKIIKSKGAGKNIKVKK